ncbi:hypothetical protein BJV82DRAFT_586410 [Fennellomyces sp. T-0311]|nr:hypothetical protein BJV82DRAFT_586410 [Fennellomyces sp. T-0311]
MSASSDDEDSHSFDSCPLRTSSSLFIVHQRDQTIVTATDEIFDILGHSPADVIGKNIGQLLETLHDDTFPRRCVARDTRGTRIKFQACIHRDPLQTTTGALDYWLVRPLDPPGQKKISRHNRFTLPTDATTVLMLSPYGIVDRVYHVMHQELQPASPATRQLIGMPIMAFIHSEDLQILCGQLNMTYRRIQPTFDVRWLANGSSKEDEYQWITVTGMPQSKFKKSAQITCVIEPITVQEDRRLIEAIYDTLRSLYDDLTQKAASGKAYVLEFLGHILMSIVPITSSNDEKRALSNQPTFIAVQKTDTIEMVPLVYKLQCSYRAVLDTYYYSVVKEWLSVSKAIGSITQMLPAAEVLRPAVENYIEWAATAIRPASKRFF